MDPTGAWAAYGQHYQRLGAGSVNPTASSLAQSGQLNDLSLSASLPRQDAIGGYGGGSHPSLILSHHGLNVSQGGHHPGEAAAAASFVNSAAAGLLSSGYDQMLSSFQSSAKAHLPPLNVPHGPGLYKAMGVKESEIGELRGGFVRRPLPPSAMAPDSNISMATSSGLFNPQAPHHHSWRHPNIVPSATSSPFGVLPHEAILPRSADSMDKLHGQDHRSKSSRMMMDTGRYMDQELASAAAAAAAAHGYRNVLSAAQGRSAAGIIDPNAGSRSSLMMQQSDPLGGPSAESLGLSGLKSSDYTLYSNSNRNLLSQNYLPQSHFPQELQGEKRELYDLSLLQDKVEGYGGGGANTKSHVDLFSGNSSQSVSANAPNNSSAMHGNVNPGSSSSSSQRASHRSSGSSSNSQSHNRSMCSSQSQSRGATTHSVTYTTYSPTSTAASYSQSYQGGSQPSPSHSQPMHSPAHFSSTPTIDFGNTIPPAHGAPVSTSHYPQTTILSHNNTNDALGVVYSSVITRANVPPASSGMYASPLMSHKVMPSSSSKHHVTQGSQGEPKHPAPTPPPIPPQSNMQQRAYEPVIRPSDMPNDGCMSEMIPGNHVPAALARVANTPTGSTGGRSSTGSGAGNLTPIDHNLIQSPSLMAPTSQASDRGGSGDNSCQSPKSLSIENVFNPQQMTLQDLADMSSSNDKMDLESGGVGLLQPPKGSMVVEDEPRLMDLSQPPQTQMPAGAMGHMNAVHHMKVEEKKKKRSRKKKKQLQEEEEEAAMHAAMKSANGVSAAGQQPFSMLPMGMPPQGMCPSESPVSQMYPASSCASRSCMPSPMMPNSPNYPMPPAAPHQMAYPGDGQQQQAGVPVDTSSCRVESAPPGFNQNGGLGVVVEGMAVDQQHHLMPQGIPPPSPPLASLFDPVPMSPQGNAEAAAFEEKLRNEASQIAKKKLDRRGPSIEDDLGFLAELPPVCNVALEKRRPDVYPKVASSSTASGNNFIDSFLKFLEGGDGGSGLGEGHRSGGRGRGKSGGGGGGGGGSRDAGAFSASPQGKNAEMNPATGQFTCTEKARGGVGRGGGAQPNLPAASTAKYQQPANPHKKTKSGALKYSANVGDSKEQQHLLLESASLAFSSEEEEGEGMANQGFVDSVKIALQSLSDNEGFDANQEQATAAAASWANPVPTTGAYGLDCPAQEQQQNPNSAWAPMPEQQPRVDHVGGSNSMGGSGYGAPKGKSPGRKPKNKWGKANQNNLEGSPSAMPGPPPLHGAPAQSHQLPPQPMMMPTTNVNPTTPTASSCSTQNDQGEFSDKEFFDFSTPRRELSMRKCKEKVIQKRKGKGQEAEETAPKPYDSDTDPMWSPLRKNVAETKTQSSASEDESVKKKGPGLRGRRKGRPCFAHSGLPRGRPPGKRLCSETDGEPAHPDFKPKKPRGRGRPKLSDYAENKIDHENTIKEGGFRLGDFVILQSDKTLADSAIWRIESHGFLQKYEPFKDGDRILHRASLTPYSGVKMGAKSLYEPITVLIVKSDRVSCVVQYLRDFQRGSSNANSSHKSREDDEMLAQKENFEVYLQTLISQVLDPNFISEIVKENDEYFLSHVHEIDGIVNQKKALLAKKILWNTAMRDCAEHFPTVTVRPFSAERGCKLMCQACAKECVSLRKLTFEGSIYDYTTLGMLQEMPPGKKLDEREYSLCTNCTDMVQVYSHLHHQKYCLFIMCTNKVNSIRTSDPSKESHVILEQCLQDSLWINKLFGKIRNIWRASGLLCR